MARTTLSCATGELGGLSPLPLIRPAFVTVQVFVARSPSCPVGCSGVTCAPTLMRLARSGVPPDRRRGARLLTSGSRGPRCVAAFDNEAGRVTQRNAEIDPAPFPAPLVNPGVSYGIRVTPVSLIVNPLPLPVPVSTVHVIAVSAPWQRYW